MFKLTKSLALFLYGVNSESIKHIQNLVQKGYNVKGFIDARADQLGSVGRWEVLGANRINQADVKNVCVVIMLQNGIMHNDIAQEIYDLGIDKILFIPTNDNFSRDKSLVMLEQYSYFINGEYNENQDFFLYTELLQKDVNMYSEKMISMAENSVIALVSTEYIHSSCDEKLKSQPALYDLPLIALQPYLELYDYLSNKEDDCIGYKDEVAFYGRSYNPRLNFPDVLKHRVILYEKYCYEINRGMDFFNASPIKVKWNTKDYFNIVDGHHRATFLFYRGIRLIPCIMSRRDYDAWRNLNTPCTMVPTENYFITVVEIIQKEFGVEQLKGKSVIDFCSDNCFFARNVKRMGAKYIQYITDSIESEMHKLLSKLSIQLCDFNELLTSTRKEECDIVFIDEEDFSDNDLLEKVLDTIYCMKHELLIYVSRSDATLTTGKSLLFNKYKDSKQIGRAFNINGEHVINLYYM